MFLDLGFVLLLHVFFVGVLGVFVFLYKDILLSWEHLSTVKVQLVLLSFFLFMSYFVFFDCLGGQTPGKHLFHIEVSWKSDKWRFLRVMTRVLATPFFFLYMKDKSFFHDCVSRSYVRKTTLV
ncbi:MAG: RDD family protein [Deltaproteobacteria bacterium]|nr:RDD family protein [Deltaproteobacteria bacterium]